MLAYFMSRMRIDALHVNDVLPPNDVNILRCNGFGTGAREVRRSVLLLRNFWIKNLPRHA